MIQIDPIRAFSDNYIWLLQDATERRCAVVDPGDAAPVLAWLEAHPGWTLSDILITHHHGDHVGGVAELKARTGATVYGPAHETIPARDRALEDGERIEVLGLTFEVFHVPGHTLGHIAYFHDDATAPVLFSGDTLFAAGCGRLFEGTAEQMHTALSRLAALPAPTRVYCTHEYTLGNLRFACAVEPGNPAIEQRFEAVRRLREEDGISLPSSIALERETNPFLRVGEASVIAAADKRSGSRHTAPAAVFATLRSWKDTF